MKEKTHMIETMNKDKSGLFEKINQIDKLPTRLIEKKHKLPIKK